MEYQTGWKIKMKMFEKEAFSDKVNRFQSYEMLASWSDLIG